MAADGTITLDIAVNERGLQQGLNKAGNSIKSALGGIGKALAGIFAISKIMEFVKACTDMASDVQEVQNVVDTAFGDMKQDMEDFADTAIEKFGISALTAKRTGSTYMSMARGMGLVGEDASKMSLNLTALSADMASFYNQSQDMTALALNSVFTGETETLKKYGIVMTQVNLEEYARTKGITKSIQAMTQQEQTLLRYNYVMEQTRLAQGDFAKTGDSWANQTRKLSENFKNLQVEFGKAFVQIGTLFVPILNKIIEGLTVIAQLAQKAANWIAVMITGEELQTDTSEQIAQSVENQEELTEAVEDTNKALKNSTASFFEINKISQATGDTAKKADTGAGFSLGIADYNEQEVKTVTDHISEKLIGAFNAVKTWVGDNFGDTFATIGDEAAKNFEKTKEIAGNIGSTIKENLPSFKEWLSTDFVWTVDKANKLGGHMFNGVWDSANTVLDDLSTTVFPRFAETFVNDILPSTTTITNRVLEIGETVFDDVKALFDRIWKDALAPFVDTMSAQWSDMWDTLAAFINGEGGENIHNSFMAIFGGIGDTLLYLWDEVLAPFFEWLNSTLTPFYEEHIKPLFDNFLSYISKIGEWLSVLWNDILTPVFKYIIDKLAPKIQNILQTIWKVILDVAGGIADVIGGIFKALGGLMDFIIGIFTGDWEKAWNGIKEFFVGIWDAIWGAIKAVINGIIDLINGLWKGLVQSVESIVNGLGNAIKTVGDVFGQEWGWEVNWTDVPLIPKLAQGAVLPANNPFLAIVGDQKRGTNIEAPLDTIVQAFRQANAENGGNAATIAILNQILQAIQRGQNIYMDGELVAQVIDNANTTGAIRGGTMVSY